MEDYDRTPSEYRGSRVGAIMTDNMSSEQRSRNMSAVKGKNTVPELFVRRALYRNGFRYRLHCAELPGRPDVVLRSFRTVVFVHGCFWHGHQCRRGALPKSRLTFWGPKIRKNVSRDRKATRSLRRAGWRVVTIWACRLPEQTALLVADLRRRGIRRRNSRGRRRKTRQA